MPARSPSLPALLAVALGAVFIFSYAGTPWRILLPALLPALLQAGMLVWMCRRLGADLLAASFFCGAVAASFVAAALNQEIAVDLAAALGHDRSRWLTPLVAAPVVEELAKGGAVAVLLLVGCRRARAVTDAIVCGALVGVGFALAENVNYLLLAAVLGGEGRLLLMIYQRLLGSLNHPIFTATFAAGIGFAWQARVARVSSVAVSVGASAAIAQHVAWNAVTSGLTGSWLCASTSPGGVCTEPDAISVLVKVPLLIAASLAPGAIGLAVVALRASRAEPR